MDDPAIDEAEHRRALQGLERINWISRSAGLLWPSIRAFAHHRHPRPTRILDIATGAGDVARAIWRRGRRLGLALDVDGCDFSPVAVRYANAQAARDGAAVRFFPLDALRQPLPAEYDIMMSSLFLHHLDESAAVRLLQKMAAAVPLVLINDLIRSRTGYLLACLGTQAISRSKVVHTDGPRSVEAAFTTDEVLQLARQAGLEGAMVTRHWPQRYLLAWKRP